MLLGLLEIVLGCEPAVGTRLPGGAPEDLMLAVKQIKILGRISRVPALHHAVNSIVRSIFDVDNRTAVELQVHLEMAQAPRRWIMNEIRECDR